MQHSKSTISTHDANRYIKRLCKHFSHKVDVDFNETSGHVDFPFAQCRMNATDEALTFNISAENQENLQRAQKVISSHTNQFAREESFEWQWQ